MVCLVNENEDDGINVTYWIDRAIFQQDKVVWINRRHNQKKRALFRLKLYIISGLSLSPPHVYDFTFMYNLIVMLKQHSELGCRMSCC